jgi:UDP-N-acetyl-D-glucosamine dehydrogenase
LGVAYKPDIDDLRESPVLKIITLLEKEGAVVVVNDPFIPKFSLEGREYNSVELTVQTLRDCDIAVITTNHSSYDAKFIAENAPAVFDTRNLTAGVDSANVERL